MLLLLWPEGRASRRGRRFVWTGIGALALGTFAVLLLQGPYAGGGLGFTLSTRFGQALVARLLLTLAFACSSHAHCATGGPGRSRSRCAWRASW